MTVRIRVRSVRGNRRMMRFASQVVALLILGVLVTPMTGAALQRRTPAQAAVEGWAALKEHRVNEAYEAFTEAAKAEPNNVNVVFGAGVAAYMLGLNADAAAWLERALRLQPRITEASMLLAELQYAAGRATDAIATLEAGLKYAPSHAGLNAKLAERRRESQLHERFYQAQGAHFTVLFEGPADQALARRAVEMLEAAYWRVGGILNAYPAGAVTVILYTREQFRDITRAPEWSAGVYDGRIKVPMRGALDRPADLERVLTHEYVHALVDSLAGDSVPVWINEGLATTLEPGGREFAESFLGRTTTRIPYPVLHRSFADLPDGTAGLAYAQSAVAVQRIMDLRGAPALVSLLKAMGSGASFEAAFHQNVYMRYDDFQASLR